MKPHFGQPDAAMNKLAGINQFPNAGKGLEQIAELEAKAKEAGFETPLEYLRAKHEEAAGMGLEPEFFARNMTNFMTPKPPTKGYFGHEDGCDCAVCENMYFRELYLNRKAADLEEVKRLAYQAGFDAAMDTDFDPIKERDAAYDLGYKEGRSSLKLELLDWLNNGFDFENSVATVHTIRETINRFTLGQK